MSANLIEHACSICPAGDDQPCITPSGRIMAEPHAHRAWFAVWMAQDAREARPEYVGPHWREARDRWIRAANLDGLRKAMAVAVKDLARFERDMTAGNLKEWTPELIERERADSYAHMANVQRRIYRAVAGAK